jgi:hypothetical protein
MKNLLIVLFFFLSLNITYSQKIDTLQFDIGKEGGFRRIRELDLNDVIRKVWITNWRENEIIEKSFSQYDSNGKEITDVDSIFDSNNNLIEFDRKIGETIEGDHQEFDKYGTLIRRDISLHINGQYIIFQKYYNDGWSYRSIIDGDPPDYIPINEERFEEAVKIYNDRLLFDKILN